MSPNAYVSNDPKDLLMMLEQNASKTGMQCKNTTTQQHNKIEFKFPLADGQTLINFEVNFEKGLGLYKVRFSIPDEDKQKL